MDGGSVSLGEIEQHFWLTRSVARVVGVNLSKAMSDGQLTPLEYSEMVARCRNCGYQAACLNWLASQACCAPGVPDHCAHSDLLARLCRGQADGSARSKAAVADMPEPDVRPN